MIKKKIAVFGAGAIGSTIVKGLNQLEAVGEILCADYNLDAAQKLIQGMAKASAVQVDAGNIDGIVEVAKGVDVWEYTDRDDSFTHDNLVFFSENIYCFEVLFNSLSYYWN